MSAQTIRPQVVAVWAIERIHALPRRWPVAPKAAELPREARRRVLRVAELNSLH